MHMSTESENVMYMRMYMIVCKHALYISRCSAPARVPPALLVELFNYLFIMLLTEVHEHV